MHFLIVEYPEGGYIPQEMWWLMTDIGFVVAVGAAISMGLWMWTKGPGWLIDHGPDWWTRLGTWWKGRRDQDGTGLGRWVRSRHESD